MQFYAPTLPGAMLQDYTALYLRTTQANEIGQTYYDLLPVAGAAIDTAVVDTAVAGTQIQFTHSEFGSLVQWISGRAPVGGFTLLSADITIWAKESTTLANVGGRLRLFKRATDGTETELANGPFDDGVEFTTSDAEYSWLGNATDTVFLENERLLIKLYITNIVIMALGTATLSFNAAEGATGDSQILLYPAVTFKAEPTVSASTVDAVPVRYIVSVATANIVPVETVTVWAPGVVYVHETVGPANVVPVREAATETPRVKVLKV